jgi:hypothetical protein
MSVLIHGKLNPGKFAYFEVADSIIGRFRNNISALDHVAKFKLFPSNEKQQSGEYGDEESPPSFSAWPRYLQAAHPSFYRIITIALTGHLAGPTVYRFRIA